MKTQKVYIIVLNWNGLDDTRECLASLRLLNKRSFEVQIVLVDNSSKKDEGAMLKGEFPEIFLIQNAENKGFAEGNNVAFRYCFKQDDCDFIMILNNDTIVDPQFMSGLIDFLNSHPKSIVGPKLLYEDRRDTVQTLGGKLFLGGTINCGEGESSELYSGVLGVDFLSGACFMASRKVFSDVGLFDAKYFAYLEDLDWCLEARGKGYGIFLDADSMVYHKHSRSTRGSFAKVYLIVRNNIYFAFKRYGFFKRWAHILSYLCIGLFLNIFRYRSWRFFPHFWRGIKDGLKGL